MIGLTAAVEKRRGVSISCKSANIRFLVHLLSSPFPSAIFGSLLSERIRPLPSLIVCRSLILATDYIMSAKDEGYQIALQEAKIGMTEGEIPVGACIVSKKGTVIGRGRNTRYLSSTFTAFDER